MTPDLTPPADAVAWARAVAQVLAKAGRSVEEGSVPAAVAAALSARGEIDIPALGSAFLTPFRLPVPVPGPAEWEYVADLGPADSTETDGTVAADAGAGDVSELGYLLAAGTAALRAGRPPSGFRVTVSQEFFVSVAKLRALRVGWDRIRTVSGLPSAPVRVHAVTNARMYAAEDVHTNLIRSTVAAAAAVVGGADALTVLPFDAATGRSSELRERLAHNISRLLAGESFLARNADPAAGAFALEELTRRLAAAAWAEFQTLDGKVADRLADGSLPAAWAAQASARAAAVADGERVVVGVNRFQVAS